MPEDRHVMDAASMVAAQLEDLVSETRRVRLALEGITQYLPGLIEPLRQIANALESERE